MADALHLLVVDAGDADRTALVRIVELGIPGAAIDQATTADAALAMVQDRSYDCILLDDGIGLELVREIRARGNKTPIVLLATPNADLVEDALSAGITDYVQKSDLAPRRVAIRVRFAMRVGEYEVAKQEATVAAQRAATARADVLAVVSHDLRGPLHAIGLAVDALRDEVPEGGKRYLAAIERAAGRAERLITDLLEASSIENGGLTLTTSSVDAAALLRQAAQDHELAARETGGKITAHVPEGSLVVKADRDRVLQVLQNLIGNALKHAKGAPIDLLVASSDTGARFTVRDKGPGIAPTELPHIFDRYWRGRKKSGGGAGLGLAIAKGIVTAHGGELDVRSSLGAGTEFVFTLPLAR